MTSPARASFLPLLGLAVALVASSAVHAQAPAAPPAAKDAAPLPANIDDWSDALWNAARTGDHASVDLLLEHVPDGVAEDRVKALREAVARHDHGISESREASVKAHAEKLKDMQEAVAAGNPNKALVDAAYLKYLSDDWKKELQEPSLRAVVAAMVVLMTMTPRNRLADFHWTSEETIASRMAKKRRGAAIALIRSM
jgi:hypothetical protein